MDVTLSLTSEQAARLHAHLFPADGCEAVAIALCGHRSASGLHRLLLQDIHLIPYDQCHERRPDLVRWPTRLVLPFLDEANRRGLSLVKVHGHHFDYPQFSATDDASDRELFASVPGWIDADVPHASVIALSDGRFLGRTFSPLGSVAPLERIMVVGDDLRFYFADGFSSAGVLPEFTRRHAQAFGQNTVNILRRLTIAVVGCSGTGSPVVEQLARLGVGRLILVDPDIVEEKNLNRILHATMADVTARRFKVDVLADAIRTIGLGTEIIALPRSLFDREVVQAVAGADVVFGCMDSAEGRRLLNRLATYYVLPYIDLGVKLQAGTDGAIDQVSGAVHYLQPGRSSLLSRKVIDLETVRAEGMRRRNPTEYAALKRERYITGVDEERPAVISVNLMVAAMAVNELLARIHDYRTDGNAGFAEWRVSLSHGMFDNRGEGNPCPTLAHSVGLGDTEPMLGDPELSA